MIALDTNVLIALHRRDRPGHAAVTRAFTATGGDRARWALPWPCCHEFFAVATHPRIFAPPSTPEQALEALARWHTRPRFQFLAEDEGYLEILALLVRAAAITGARIHDARIVALCLRHGVRELWTADRDFSRFPQLRTRNPLVAVA